MSGQDKQPPTKFGVVLFPGFQALDVFGPLDALNNLSRMIPLEFTVLAATLDPVNTKVPSPGRIGQSVVPTHTFDNYPKDLEVLLVPGGFGARDPAITAPIVEFLKRIFPQLRHLLTVCTGSAIVAQSGLLDGKRATSNKRSWEWATSQGSAVEWVREARWVADGNIWTVRAKPSHLGSSIMVPYDDVLGLTDLAGRARFGHSSGVSAGIDLMFAFIADQYGEETAKQLADIAEYVRNPDSSVDPFA
ncbi:hypothetical protein GQX73_g4581 [Xylaria multiplex]|uniref:DJ-1/PfpI domain-containing protein n=1 Tax=Xylaria multiplex TaxID=323545 RepID=A0A7C8IU10_9PEZI|nr:hypothetical protein GQX73_g4581 [Xylaria multiplex]